MKAMLIGAFCMGLWFLVLAAGQDISSYKPTCGNPVVQIEHPRVCHGPLSVN